MLTRIMTRMRERRAESVNLGNPRDPALMRVFGISPTTTAGVPVSEETAANLSAVFCAVRCIAETAAGLPLYAYTRNGDDRERDANHPASRLLRNPNPSKTRMVFRETALADCLLWGNFFAEIISRGGVPVAMWRFHPSQVTIIDNGRGAMAYQVNEDGIPRVITASRMIHVPSPFDGRSVVGFARESFGLSLAAEQMGAGVFGNGGRVGGVLTLSRPATEERKIEVARDWNRHFGGASNQGKIAVLDHESSYQQVAIPPNDAQFLETRQFQIEEVCRWFRLSPTKLMDFRHATYSNIEEVNRSFATESILPWTKRFDQEFDRKLLTESERDRGMFVEHDLSGLLEGDIESQSNYFATARQWGWLSTNEIRRKQNLNGIGPAGDVYLQPGNMMPAGEDSEDQADVGDTQDGGPPDDSQDEPAAVRELREQVATMRAWIDEYNSNQGLRAVQAVVGKFWHKESRDIAEACGKPRFLDWLDGFYRRHSDKLASAMSGAGYPCQDAILARCERHRRAIVDACDCQPAELADKIQAVLDKFSDEMDDFARSICDAQ